jgi:hypothetical protein
MVHHDPDNSAIHEAILAVCEAVDMIRQYKASVEIPVRDEYEGGRKIGNAIGELESEGWLLELEEGVQEVFGVGHDYEAYWTIRIRPATEGERSSEPGDKAGAK